jgi:hypothetical protein
MQVTLELQFESGDVQEFSVTTMQCVFTAMAPPHCTYHTLLLTVVVGLGPSRAVGGCLGIELPCWDTLTSTTNAAWRN